MELPELKTRAAELAETILDDAIAQIIDENSLKVTNEDIEDYIEDCRIWDSPIPTREDIRGGLVLSRAEDLEDYLINYDWPEEIHEACDNAVIYTHTAWKIARHWDESHTALDEFGVQFDGENVDRFVTQVAFCAMYDLVSDALNSLIDSVDCEGAINGA